MARLINADALGIGKCNPDVFNDEGYAKGWNSAIEILQNAPTVDAVPVCRCKDCDMWNEEDFSGRKSLGNYRCVCAVWSNFEDGRRVYTGSDEFCSRGERKGGDE